MTHAQIEGLLRGRARFGPRLGLEHISALLVEAGARREWDVGVQVAGTNGKGSVSALLQAIGVALGRRTAGYVSPHLQEYRERIRWQGLPLSRASFVTAMGVALRADAACSRDLGEATEFELLTVAAMADFTRRQADWVVLEVGLGGRLDATSAVSLPVAVITSVSRDHARVLGNSVAQIAAEKAAIIRPGQLVVSSARGVAAEVVAARAREVGAELWRLGAEVGVAARVLGWRGVEARVRTPLGEMGTFRSPLRGPHQAENLALALAAADGLASRTGIGWDRQRVAAGLAETVWPGRMELLEAEASVVLVDGAHNPAGARSLVRAMRELQHSPPPGRNAPPRGPLQLVLALLREKEAGPICKALADLRPGGVWLPRLAEPRGREPGSLRRWWPQAVECESVAEALSGARRAAAAQDGLTLVCGSLALAGEARSALGLAPA